MNFAVLKDLIMKAKCDVLVILDCCNAGVVVKPEDGAVGYSKEVIAATSWGTETYNKLAPALCEALKVWDKQSESRSAKSLFVGINTQLMAMRCDEREQTEEEHKKLSDHYMKAQENIKQLKDEQAKIEKKMKRLWREEVGQQDIIKGRWVDLPQEIGRLEVDVKCLTDQISNKKTKLKGLRDNKDKYVQAIYSPWVSRKKDWALRRS